MKNDEFEDRLRTLSLAPPSAEFLENGLSILRRNRRNATSNPGWRFAFATVLLLSLSTNILQLRQNQIAVESGGVDIAGRADEGSSEQFAPSGVFGFLCLTRSALVLNEAFYLGELQGFGEWVSLQVPDAYRLSLSFQPLRDWQAIGSYEDGVITVQANPGQQLTLRGVGMGPQNSRPSGPLPIYGEVATGQAELPLDTGHVANARKALASNETAQRAQAAPNSPYPLLTDVVLGVDQPLGMREQQAFGRLINDNECG